MLHFVFLELIKDKYKIADDEIKARIQKWLQKTGDRKRYKEQQARRQAELERNERNLLNNL